MARLVGKWKLEKSEKFDEYMKAVGVGFATRKLGNMTKPTTIISIDGDSYCIQTKSSVKTTEVKSPLGVEFDETTADGRKVRTTLTVEGDRKIIQSQKADVDSVITRELQDDDTLLLTCTAKDVVSTRIYKRDS